MVTTVSSAKTDEPIEVRLGRKTLVGPKSRVTLAPFGEYDGSICAAAAAMRPVAVITVATCFFPKCLPQCRTALSRISKQCFASKFAFGALTLLVGCQGEHLACKIE